MDDSRATDLGERIRRERHAQNLSQQALAKMVGTNQQTVEKIETGKTKHSSFLPQILTALGIGLDALVNQRRMPVEPTAAIPLTGVRDLPVYGAAEGGKGA